MRPPRLLSTVTLALLLFQIPAALLAQSSAGDKNFVVHLNLDNIRDSKLGGKLMEAVRTKAAEEIDGDRDADEAFANIEKALGFDPFHEIHSVTIQGVDITEPLDGLQVVVGMGNSTGNLEGLLLALPGYESTNHDEHTIHSVQVEDDMRVHGAIHGDSNSGKQVVLATSKNQVVSMLDSLEKKSPSDIGRRSKRNKNELVNVFLNHIPDIDDLDGPPKTIARLLEQVTLSVQSDGDELNVVLELTTDDDKHAEQLQQLAQGLVAMVSLAKESDDDEDLAMVADLLDGLETDRVGTEVRLRLQVPEKIVVDFMRDELDIPLD